MEVYLWCETVLYSEPLIHENQATEMLLAFCLETNQTYLTGALGQAGLQFYNAKKKASESFWSSSKLLLYV